MIRAGAARRICATPHRGGSCARSSSVGAHRPGREGTLRRCRRRVRPHLVLECAIAIRRVETVGVEPQLGELRAEPRVGENAQHSQPLPAMHPRPRRDLARRSRADSHLSASCPVRTNGRSAIHPAMRFFNTTGPVVATDHYCISPLERLNLDEILGLVRDKRYFILRAPRQTGKTSALLSLQDLLNSGTAGEYRCVYANLEAGQALREDVEAAMRAVLYEMEFQARATLGDESLASVWPGMLERAGPGNAFRRSWRDGVGRDRQTMRSCDARPADGALNAPRRSHPPPRDRDGALGHVAAEDLLVPRPALGAVEDHQVPFRRPAAVHVGPRLLQTLAQGAFESPMKHLRCAPSASPGSPRPAPARALRPAGTEAGGPCASGPDRTRARSAGDTLRPMIRLLPLAVVSSSILRAVARAPWISPACAWA